MDLLGFTPTELQHWSSSLKGTRDIWGAAELSGIRARAGGSAFSQTKVLAEAIVPLMRLPLTEPTGRHHIPVSINMAITVCVTLMIP